MPETDSAHDREVTGQPDHAVAHMLGGRDALDLRGEVHPLVLVVQVGTLRDDEPILDNRKNESQLKKEAASLMKDPATTITVGSDGA